MRLKAVQIRVLLGKGGETIRSICHLSALRDVLSEEVSEPMRRSRWTTIACRRKVQS